MARCNLIYLKKSVKATCHVSLMHRDFTFALPLANFPFAYRQVTSITDSLVITHFFFLAFIAYTSTDYTAARFVLWVALGTLSVLDDLLHWSVRCGLLRACVHCPDTANAGRAAGSCTASSRSCCSCSLRKSFSLLLTSSARSHHVNT